MSMKINCSILTPDRVLYEGQVHFAVVQAYDGEVGFLFNHAPFVSELGVGEVRLRTGDLTEYLVVEGGFVEMRDNHLTLLAETALKKEDLNRSELEKSLNEFLSKKSESPEERIRLEVEVRRLKARVKVASH
ncbi:MAG TPA: ATP synthase F1 subunit epsilon [Spirochaetes bacterium]|nr:ATP synthase F1 subunit epsilon [Spirochaetota bacterium]